MVEHAFGRNTGTPDVLPNYIPPAPAAKYGSRLNQTHSLRKAYPKMTDLSEEFEQSPEWAEKYSYSKAWPLPRFSPPHTPSKDKYEVVVAGAGPSGMHTAELAACKKLTRYLRSFFNPTPCAVRLERPVCLVC